MTEIKRAKQASNADVDSFLKGNNPMEHVIKVECGYDDKFATVIWRDNDYNKHYDTHPFYPFCWAKRAAGQSMCKGNRTELKLKMQEYGISCKALVIANENGEIHERMDKGYNIMFYATKPMSNQRFSKFFDDVNVPLKPRERHWSYGKNYYKTVAPNEQFMIATGIRLFKGYDSYDDIKRMQFDIETSGLDPKVDTLDQIGIRTNKGFEKIITITGNTPDEYLDNAHSSMCEFYDIIAQEDPDVVSGYNSENFDWNFFDVFGYTHYDEAMSVMSKRPGLEHGVYKKEKQSVLKLGGEMEYYRPTVMWGKHITDCLFSVRRAQALDSNMKKATLKYVTKYSKINKTNRVYVPGKIINTTWADTNLSYAFNDENGDWYKVTDKKPLLPGYELKTGRYIVQRYLLDDIWETDKVELRYNESNFLVGKMLPVNFERMCTMGTATIWKYIMMAWSYEQGLAIPLETSSRPFTGGLSRLLKVGYIPNVQKLDYNSLYPSIILSFAIKTKIDISGAMPAMLEYILTQREYYKGLKGEYGKKANAIDKEIDAFVKQLRQNDEFKDLDDKSFGKLVAQNEQVLAMRKQQEEYSALATRNDKMQLPLKITANAFFGSFGAGGGIFPWADMDCAEETTCCGRQMLRLMLKWFTDLGYEGIVCDSVTGDTPLFVKYTKSNIISIKPIEGLFKQSVKYDDGRCYDYNAKDYQILGRDGWEDVKYLYKHSTDKDVYRVEDNGMTVDVTKDHSLFDSEKHEIKPTDITVETKLEYYDSKSIFKQFNNLDVSDSYLRMTTTFIKNKKNCDCIPDDILNSTIECKTKFLQLIENVDINIDNYTKTLVAGVQFIRNCVLL